MPNTLKIKRGTAATIPNGQLAEPLFTTDTYDLYIGKGNGSNQRFQKYIASGTSSQFLKGDGSLDSTSYQPLITAGTTLQYYRGDKTFQTLNTSVVPESGAIYFTEPRVLATVLTGLNLSGGGTIAATDSVLTAFGKIQNQISGLAGGVSYQGTWNASTNNPSLTSSVGTKGYYYVVSVAGSTNLNGITDWKVGDWAIFNGTTWDKVDNTDAVSSVNGFTGAVNLGLGDISNVTLTSPTNAQLLRFNGTSSKWENWTPTYISAAITSLNGLTAATQTFATGTTGTDFTISSSTSTHTFNIPSASATSRGLLTSGDYNTFALKQSQLNGTGFVKASGTTISYDNSTYLPTSGGTVTSLSITTLTGSVYADATGALGTTQGTANTIAYWGSSYSLASLPLSTYPSLTELSYVKGVTSAIQTQLNSKQATISLTTSGTSGAATFSSNTLNIPNYSTIYSADGTLSGNRTVTAGTNSLTFSSSRTSGTPFSFNSTQTAANASDLGDGTMAVNHTITGSTGTELVIRAMSFGITNGMSGGTVTNYRGWNVASNTSAGSTTTNLDQVYIEAGTYAGTVTSSRAIRINNMLGTNRAAIAINALGGLNNNVYLLLGDTTIPTGNWGIYQSESSYSNYLNGNTSIGTTAGGYRLNVAGTGNFSGALTGTSATFSSSVGINTTPSYKLHLVGGNEVGSRFIVTGTYAPIQFSGDNGTTLGGINAYAGNVVIGGGTSTGVNSSLSISASTGAATFSSSVTSNAQISATYFRVNNSNGLSGYLIPQATWLGTGTATNLLIAAETGNSIGFMTNGTTDFRMFINTSGNVGIGTTSPVSTQSGLDISSGGISLVIGADSGSNTRTNATSKVARIASYPYTNANTPSAMMVAANDSTNNTLWIGGGSGLLNASTSIEFYTAANNNTAAGTQRMIITSGGNILMGKTSVDWSVVGIQTENNSKNLGITHDGVENNLFLRKNNATGTMIRFWYNSTEVGSISISTTATAYNTSSDYRLKEDLQPIKGLEKVLAIKTYNYKWKTSDERMDGVLAHELQQILPYAVFGIKDGEQMQGVDYSKLTPILVKAIQEQQVQIEELKAKLN